MTEDTLPPYFRINPDKALAELPPQIGTAEFQAIAEACGKGRQDLASRGMDENGQKTLRINAMKRFSTHFQFKK